MHRRDFLENLTRLAALSAVVPSAWRVTHRPRFAVDPFQLGVGESPHLRWYDGRRGYVRCAVTPDEWRTDYRVVPFVSRPGAPIETASSWRLVHGRPGLEQT